jgi:hypothetical protein
MNTQSCSCCDKQKTPPKYGSSGRRYNKPKGTNAKWARHHRRELRTEFTVRVKGGKRFCGPQWQKDSCGDGTFGFPTRRKRRDEVTMETGLDGQLKKKRNTLINSRSARSIASRHPKQVWGNRCAMWSNIECGNSRSDPIVIAERESMNKKSNRRNNRNRAAARGHKLSLRRAV